MAAIPSAGTSPLRIDVNKSPIAYITIPSSLDRLSVIMDSEYSKTSDFYETRSRVALMVKPAHTDVGIVTMRHSIVEVCACKDVQAELDKLHEQSPTIDRWYFDDLKDQRIVHTVQVPVQALHQEGFITSEQVERISSFVRSHRLQNMA
jgi:hypothetical protein